MVTGTRPSFKQVISGFCTGWLLRRAIRCWAAPSTCFNKKATQQDLLITAMTTPGLSQASTGWKVGLGAAAIAAIGLKVGLDLRADQKAAIAAKKAAEEAAAKTRKPRKGSKKFLEQQLAAETASNIALQLELSRQAELIRIIDDQLKDMMLSGDLPRQ
jgi:hypothetical protein